MPINTEQNWPPVGTPHSTSTTGGARATLRVEFINTCLKYKRENVTVDESRSSSVNIVIRLRTRQPGFDSRLGLGFFSHHRIQTGNGAPQPTIQWTPEILSAGVKRPEREANYSSRSCVEVKKVWSYTFTPQYFFMAWCLIKQLVSLYGMVFRLITGTTSALPFTILYVSMALTFIH
jgi:hypothetical protein